MTYAEIVDRLEAFWFRCDGHFGADPVHALPIDDDLLRQALGMSGVARPAQLIRYLIPEDIAQQAAIKARNAIPVLLLAVLAECERESGSFRDAFANIIGRDAAATCYDLLESWWRALDRSLGHQEDAGAFRKLNLKRYSSAWRKIGITIALAMPCRRDVRAIRDATQQAPDGAPTAAILDMLVARKDVFTEAFQSLLDDLARQWRIGDWSQQQWSLWNLITAARSGPVRRDPAPESRTWLVGIDPDLGGAPEFILLTASDDDRDDAWDQVVALRASSAGAVPPPWDPGAEDLFRRSAADLGMHGSVLESGIYLFTATARTGYWQLVRDGGEPIGRILMAGQARRDLLLESLGRKASALFTDFASGWSWMDIDPPSPIRLESLPAGIADAHHLLRSPCRPRLRLSGGMPFRDGYLAVPSCLPRLVTAAGTSVRITGGGVQHEVPIKAGEIPLPPLPASAYEVALVDSAGADSAALRLHLIDPESQIAGGAAARHAAVLDPHDDARVIAPNAPIPLWPASSPGPAANLSDWLAMSLFLGPRVGELAEDARPGFEWKLSCPDEDEPILECIGDPAGLHQPLEPVRNSHKSAARRWKRAFDREPRSADPRILERFRQYRRLRARPPAEARDLGPGPLARSDRIHELGIPKRQLSPRLDRALAILIALSSEGRSIPLARKGDSERLDPQSLLGWLPDELGCSEDRIWTILRSWQECALVDLLQRQDGGGIQIIARSPRWIAYRMADRIRVSLIGIMLPAMRDRLQRICAGMGLHTSSVTGASPWQPAQIRTQLDPDQLDGFQRQCQSDLGLGLEILPWSSGTDLPEWIGDIGRAAQAGLGPAADAGGRRFCWDAALGYRSCGPEEECLLTRSRYQAGVRTSWAVRVGDAAASHGDRDTAALHAAALHGIRPFELVDACILRRGLERSTPGVYLPLAIAHLSAVLGPTLPGPSALGWQYHFPSALLAQGVFARLGLGPTSPGGGHA